MEVLPTVRNVYETAKDVGGFVLDRLIGGAWAETAETVVHPANIQYINTTGENK